ncbi:MAG: 16S rRNA (guanine(966)-N(2))-methyltransferase RsmD [Lachnospiraceae bacterium]|nr:16S rRNA (guanine(966)-N(2))-methyltransferase RsmD [Lachnospiraceae bacterium]
MRVISGTANRRRLVTPKGLKVRPTTDRIKETLFNILAPRIYDVDFLDLFAGSGGIGIEALSRGAASCVFVDNDRDSVKCIKENLDICGLAGKADVMFADATRAVAGLIARKKRFDIIFLDPPYGRELEKEVLFAMSDNLLKEDGVIIVEASAETQFDYLDGLKLTEVRVKEYGSNKHIFIERKQ